MYAREGGGGENRGGVTGRERREVFVESARVSGESGQVFIDRCE